ncbi:MAG: ACP S-malonyltransferase [Chloroflexia bacterium]
MSSPPPVDVAWLFPGQGSQCVGMGRDLAEAFPDVAGLYRQADALLGVTLSRLCFEGPEEELTRTINAQPALLTTSVAVLLALGGRLDERGYLHRPERLPRPSLVAGHSLGEYTALVAAGALPFPEALRLVRERGRLMGEARSGTMAAVIGLEEEALEGICQACGAEAPLVIANYNCPGQYVLSGATEAVERAMEEARKRGARRVIPLRVSAAFHSPLMQEAASGLARAVATAAFSPAAIPVVANTCARPLSQPEAFREELIAQVCSPVRWSASLEYMWKQGVRRFLEIGPGTVLAGLVRRTLPEAKVQSVGTLAQVQALLESER